jgi:hypothetical protein
MLKYATLIVRSIYSHKKQNKIDYKIQFSTDSMLNDKHKKNQLNKRHKKQPESTQVNRLSTIPGS